MGCYKKSLLVYHLSNKSFHRLSSFSAVTEIQFSYFPKVPLEHSTRQQVAILSVVAESRSCPCCLTEPWVLAPFLWATHVVSFTEWPVFHPFFLSLVLLLAEGVLTPSEHLVRYMGFRYCLVYQGCLLILYGLVEYEDLELIGLHILNHLFTFYIFD